MGTKRYELAESEWHRLKDMLPPEHPKEGKRGHPASGWLRQSAGVYIVFRRGSRFVPLLEQFDIEESIILGDKAYGENNPKVYYFPNCIV